MDDDYRDMVLDVVAAVPAGRVMTYGLIAEVVADRLVAAGLPARGGPRQVGQIMARWGGDVPWWRVVNASGRPPAPYADQALARLAVEGAPLNPARTAVVVRRAVWWPDDPSRAPLDPAEAPRAPGEP
ncbi:MAG: MGMT family protein [Micrococcales bacterium]|nr:MGMT family protein [Micrococcales bacterium]